jgi:hypothetical protein
MSRYLGQLVTYAAFAAVIGLFSVWPEYRMLQENDALISVSFSHAAKRIGECRQLTQEELNELPPNMRKPISCPRERHPMFVELRADGVVILSTTLLPSGLWSDGKANVYSRTKVSAGTHQLFVGMSDSGSTDRFDYQHSAEIEIEPGQNLVVDFDGLSNAFAFK